MDVENPSRLDHCRQSCQRFRSLPPPKSPVLFCSSVLWDRPNGKQFLPRAWTAGLPLFPSLLCETRESYSS